jgi:PAS domain S-box-containing protein
MQKRELSAAGAEPFSPSPLFPVVSYGLAVALTLLALLLRWLLLSALGPSTPFLLLSIIIAAWYGGLGPGLTATTLSAAAAYFLPQIMAGNAGSQYFSPATFAASLLLLGGLISLLQESLHRAQRRITGAAQELSVSNQRFHLLVDSIKDYGIFMLDPAGYITSWNVGAEHVNGYKAPEIIGRHFSRFYPPEDLAAGKPEMELRVAIATGRYEEEGWRLRKDGSRFWANVVLSAVRDEEGALRGFSKVMRDMTERKRAEERERLLIRSETARAEAESANRAKDQFLSIISHELRTPLNAILGWTTLLRQEKLDEATTARALETIERSSRVQSRLVADLLDVSRMLAGKLSIDLQSTDISAVIDVVLDRVGTDFQEKKLDLQLSREPAGDRTAVLVAGDAVRLEQVFTNLICNAIKFTPAGGHIWIREVTTPGEGKIAVQASGHGIAREALPHLFERFRQADSSETRQHGGLGLGLAITQHLVEAHNGTITVESPGEGQGATFTVCLPRLDKDFMPDAKVRDQIKQPQPEALVTPAGDAVR